MKKKVLIIGGAGHGSLIAACIRDNASKNPDYEYEVAGFLNDYEDNIDNYQVLGKTTEIEKFASLGYYFSWGIHLIGRNCKTKDFFDQLAIPEDRLVTIVHHTAFIAENVILEPGVLVMPHVYIAPRTKIGKGTMIKANCNIGHDVITGELCHFAMGATICSCLTIGDCVDVALNATLLANVNMGNFSMLGAASLATHDVPDYEIHVGIPAKFLKRMKED